MGALPAFPSLLKFLVLSCCAGKSFEVLFEKQGRLPGPVQLGYIANARQKMQSGGQPPR